MGISSDMDEPRAYYKQRESVERERSVLGISMIWIFHTKIWEFRKMVLNPTSAAAKGDPDPQQNDLERKCGSVG